MIGLYVHLPFCLRKCPYCAFFSVCDSEDKFEAYVDRVIHESHLYSSQKVDTIYFGGGTPTVLPVNLLTKLLSQLKERFPCDGEITIEANPATISHDSLSLLHKAGFNRISIGVQSLSNDELRFLGRLHSAQDAIQAIIDAKLSGFDNISADVMFGLPGQTKKSLQKTIKQLVSLPVSHISAYSLSIEGGTPFASQSLLLPDEDTERAMYYSLRDTLEKFGFKQYEISNYAKQGLEAVHNTNYWLCGEYIGLGAGAHGYIHGIRYENYSDLNKYLTIENPVLSSIKLTDTDKLEEYYMLGLRMCDGIQDLGNPKVPALIEAGFLERVNGKIRLSNRGMDVANYVISELLL